MSVEIRIETNPLDHIRSGEVFVVPEGQLIMRAPIIIFSGGELRLQDNASLIFEE